MNVAVGLAILDIGLLIAGIVMSIMESKYKYKNKKAQDTIWKLVEYVTMCLAGSLIGGKAI
ncbi:MAG: hypothetical protein PHW73_10170 [Atribacterota bacterium]|nr:hypothetical protein [Atribacterota bacterium]